MNSPLVYFVASSILNAFTSLLLGMIVWIRDKSRPLNVTYACFCPWGAIASWSVSYAVWNSTGDVVLAALSLRLVIATSIFIPVFYAHHLCYLLNCVEEKKSIIKVGYVLACFSSFSAFSPYFMHDLHAKPPFLFWGEPLPFFHFYLILFSTYVIYGLWLVFQNYRTATGHLRKQLQYVLVASLVGWGGGLTEFPLWYNVHIPPYGHILVSAYVLITSYAIYKHRLMDISLIIRRTLIYTRVMGLLTAMYLVVITEMTHIFEGLTGSEPIFSTAIVACIITLLFQPLRKRVEAFVDAKFFRQYVDREQKLYELSREVITHTTPEAMGKALQQVLMETFHPKTGALYVRSRDGAGFFGSNTMGAGSSRFDS